jgi:penicillin-binding protein 2
LDPSTLPPPFNKYKDKPSIPGDDITLTIDWDLTRAAQKAMRYHYSGAVVMMDIHTGEVLVLYSKPGFNPNLGSFGVRKTQNFDPRLYSPMLNKALMAYPPGSTFKMITSVAGLTEGVIDPETKLFCAGDYIYRGHRFGCHAKYGHGDVDLLKALEVSCDVYYYQVGDALGMDTLAHYARDYFGLGQHTGIEIHERTGLVPTQRWHERHEERQRCADIPFPCHEIMPHLVGSQY